MSDIKLTTSFHSYKQRLQIIINNFKNLIINNWLITLISLLNATTNKEIIVELIILI